MGKKKAFSLIELSLVFWIFGLILAVTYPALSHFQQNLYLNYSTHALSSKFRKTQSLAMCSNKATETKGNDELAAGVKFRYGKKFVFSRSGSVMPGGAGTEWVENRFGKTKKIIVSSMGRIRIE